MSRIRPAVKYHGGKYYLCRWIIEQFPSHKVYVEPFGGAASVLLNKPPVPTEYYNDLEYTIYNLHNTIKYEFEPFLEAVSKAPYEKEFYLSKRALYNSAEFSTLSSLEQAVTTYIVRRMSRGGLGGTFSWSSRIYGAGIPGEVHGWLTALEELPKINDRFRFIGVCNLSAVDIIKQLDGPDTLFYLDPPYPKNTRVFKNAYKKEMNADDHRELGATLASIQGKAIISSYSSPLYDELFSGWRTLHQEIPNHSSQEKKKEKKVETIWMNF